MSSQTHAFSTPGPLTLRLRNPAGDVKITAADTAETTVEVIPRTRSSEDAAEGTRVELSGDGRRLDVEAPTRRFGSGAKLDMLVRLPAGSHVEAHTASADVQCRGRLAALDVNTASGDINADGVDGDVSVASASGNVSLGPVGGDLSAKTASGDIRVDQVGGTSRTASASGDLRLGACGGAVSARTASGDIAVQQVERGSVDVTTMSGNVAVGVRRGVNVWLDVSTLSGRTRSDLDHQDGPPSDDSDVLSLAVRTLSGNIQLNRSTLPSTPAPSTVSMTKEN